jgi:hypothetical protein
MEINADIWKLISTAGASLGVTESARKKWRVRGVPHKWRMKIIVATAGAVSHSDFDGVGTHKKLEAAE